MFFFFDFFGECPLLSLIFEILSYATTIPMNKIRPAAKAFRNSHLSRALVHT